MFRILYIASIIFFVTSCNPFDHIKAALHRCDVIQDVYYWPGFNKWETPEYFHKVSRCRYTLNHCTRPCNTNYITRGFYEEYKTEYEQWGLIYPYPPPNYNKPIIEAYRY